MKKAFDRRLSEVVSTLPSYSPNEKLWSKIENELETDEMVADIALELPCLEPSDNLWDAIELGIDENEQAQKEEQRFKRNNIYKLTVAASIAFVVVRTILFQTEKQENLRIETELIYTEQVDTETSDTELIEHFETLCTQKKQVCSTDLFEEKIRLFHELSNELQELQNAINILGESPEIIQSMKKIEGLKLDTVNELLVMLNS